MRERGEGCGKVKEREVGGGWMAPLVEMKKKSHLFDGSRHSHKLVTSAPAWEISVFPLELRDKMPLLSFYESLLKNHGRTSGPHCREVENKAVFP